MQNVKRWGVQCTIVSVPKHKIAVCAPSRRTFTMRTNQISCSLACHVTSAALTKAAQATWRIVHAHHGYNMQLLLRKACKATERWTEPSGKTKTKKQMETNITSTNMKTS